MSREHAIDMRLCSAGFFVRVTCFQGVRALWVSGWTAGNSFVRKRNVQLIRSESFVLIITEEPEYDFRYF